MNIRNAYQQAVAREGLSEDPAQERIVERLAELQSELAARQNAGQSLLRRLGIGKPLPAPKGVYLWGGVGRGKTFLMDLFFQTLDTKARKRIHFHRMMREIHESLRHHGNKADPLSEVAQEMARDTQVLCFDEFFVSDIGDAMVLGRLLSGLFERGLTLIATSNTPPQRLYEGGLQRERFLPAIKAIQDNVDVIELAGGPDYRLRLLQQANTYFCPVDDASLRQLSEIFERVCPGESTANTVIEVLGRPIQTQRCGKSVIWFEFADICAGPRSQYDYIEIARSYQTVMVSGVPCFDATNENQARRFIALVDEFYDRRVKLVLSAAVGLGHLYRGAKLGFEFERTASRLAEMKSAEYLHSAHLA